MSYDVSEPELKTVSALSAAARYRYFLNKIADWQEVWSVGDEGGWALMSDGALEVVPVWPAKAYAAVVCQGDWADHEPKAISLSAWMERWTPGMTKDQRRVAVFPLADHTAIIVLPDKLAEDIQDALAELGE